MKRLFIAWGLLLFVGGCDWTDTKKGCPMGPGLSGKALVGQGLAPQELALIFEGGPSQVTNELADALSVEDVAATFFVKGAQAAERTKALAHLKGRGHLVANGGYSGANILNVSEPILEVTRTDEIISPYVAGNVFLMRFPEEGFDDALISHLNDAGLRKYVGPVGADIASPEECRSADALACAQAYLRDIRLAGRGVVAIREDEAEILTIVKTLISTLKDEGFSFVRVDEVPGIRLALEASGAKPGIVGGPEGCNDYE